MFLGVTSRLSVASVDLSEFVNGESFVGRELARRVVSAASAKDGDRCGHCFNFLWSALRASHISKLVQQLT